MTDLPSKILIFGCGNMGGAMLRGWIAGGSEPHRFVVVDPVADDLPEGVAVYRPGHIPSDTFDTVLLGIKPQMIRRLASQITPWLADDALLVSMLAGTRIQTLSACFPAAKIVRIMPNLAAAIGKSPIGLYSPQLGPIMQDKITQMFTPLGSSVWLENEEHMDAVTALAGSGPAFVYRFIQALAMGGEKLGLPPAIAAQMATFMVEGAALLAAQSAESPAELIARVTSRGGTTAAGLAVLDGAAALETLVAATLAASRDRGGELAMGNEYES